MSTVFWVSYVLLWILVVVLTVGIFALYHHFGQMYLNTPEGRETQGPRPESRLLAMEAVDVSGQAVVLPLDQRPALIVFAATDCMLCAELRQSLLRICRERAALSVVVLCRGSEAGVLAWAGELAGVARVVADPRGRYALRYRVSGTPFGVAVGRDGVVRHTGIVNTYDQLAHLADESAGLSIVHS